MTMRFAILNGVSGIAFGLMLGLSAPAMAQEATDDPCADDGLAFLDDANPECASEEPDFLSGLDETTETSEETVAEEEPAAGDDAMAASEEPAEEPVEEETAATDDPTQEDDSLIAGAEGDAAQDDGAAEGDETAAATDDPTVEDDSLVAGSESDADLEALFGDTETASDEPEMADDDGFLAGADDMGGADDTAGSGDDVAANDSGVSSDDGDLTDPNLAAGAVSGDAEDPGVNDSIEIAADDDGSGDGSGGLDTNNSVPIILASGGGGGDALIGVCVSPDLSQLLTVGDPSNLDSLVDVGVLAPAGDQSALINATVADGLNSGFDSLVGVDLGGDSMLGNNNNLVQLTLGSTFSPIADALAGQTTLLAPLKPLVDLGVQN